VWAGGGGSVCNPGSVFREMSGGKKENWQDGMSFPLKSAPRGETLLIIDPRP